MLHTVKYLNSKYLFQSPSIPYGIGVNNLLQVPTKKLQIYVRTVFLKTGLSRYM